MPRRPATRDERDVAAGGCQQRHCPSSCRKRAMPSGVPTATATSPASRRWSAPGLAMVVSPLGRATIDAPGKGAEPALSDGRTRGRRRAGNPDLVDGEIDPLHAGQRLREARGPEKLGQDSSVVRGQVEDRSGAVGIVTVLDDDLAAVPVRQHADALAFGPSSRAGRPPPAGALRHISHPDLLVAPANATAGGERSGHRLGQRRAHATNSVRAVYMPFTLIAGPDDRRDTEGGGL